MESDTSVQSVYLSGDMHFVLGHIHNSIIMQEHEKGMQCNIDMPNGNRKVASG